MFSLQQTVSLLQQDKDYLRYMTVYTAFSCSRAHTHIHIHAHMKEESKIQILYS